MAISMGEAIGYIKLNIESFQKGFNDVKAQSAQLDSIAGGIGKAFDVAAKAAKIAFAAITAASAAAIKQTIAAGSAFEASMSQVAATMGMTADEINNNSEAYKRLSDAAKEAGATTMFSATQAAQALNYLALAGYSVEDSITTLPTILNVAAAGGMDLAAASDMVTDAMSALGLSVDEAASFADKLAKTSQKSNTNIAQLGAGILQIGGTAKSLAGGVDELNTALGILANNGIKAAEGGTALRQIILNLTAPTEKAAAYMEEIGLSAYDAAGNMKPLNRIFAELDEIMSQFSTQKEKDNILTQIFDARQLKSARALLSNYGDSWDNLYDQISNANGAASMMAETMQQNLQGAMTIAKSAIEAVQVTAYEGLQKGLTNAVQSATQAITRLNTSLSSPEGQEALKRLSETVGELIVKFADFAANKIPKVIEVLGNLEEIANGLKSALIGTGIALAGVSLGLAVGSEAARAYTKELILQKMATLGANAALLANPYTAVAAAIGVAVAAVTYFVSEIKRQNNELQETIVVSDELVESAEKLKNTYNDVKYAAEEKTGATIEEINHIRTLTNELLALAKQEVLTDEQLLEAKDIIEQLNEIYPKNTAYVQDGQIVAYEGLAEAVGRYTDALYTASQLELAKSQSSAAKEAKEAAEAALDESQEAYDKAAEAFEKYNNARLLWINSGVISKELQKEAFDNGYKNYGNYVQKMAAFYSEEVNQAGTAYNENLALLDQANADYEAAMKKRLEIEEWYGTQSETFRLQRQTQLDWGMRDPAVEAAIEGEKAKKEAVEQTWKDIAKLDHEWSMGRIATEEEYQAQRKALLEKIRNEKNEDWTKEYSKSVTWQRQQNEKALRDEESRLKEEQRKQEEAEKQRQKELEDYIEGQWENFETRHKNDTNYTEKMMIDDMEKSLEVLDKDSDLFQEYSKKVSKKRSDWVDDEKKKQEETAESNFKVWQEAYDKIQDEAEDKMRNIKTAQDNLTNSLVNSVKLYETKTLEVWNKEKQQWEQKEKKVASGKAIKDQTKELTKYMDTLDELKAKGLSENVMAQILGMSAEDGAEFAKQLNNMTQSELKEYSAAVDEMTAKAQQFSADFYAPQREKAKEDYDKALAEWKKQVPDDWQKVGEETINGFIKGIEEKAADGENAASGFIADSVDGVKELLGIHSPSTVFAEIGENVVAGLIDGVNNMRESLYNTFTVFGENSANKYIEGFKSVWESFANSASSFMAISNEIAGNLAYTPPAAQWGNNANRQSGYYSEYTGSQSYSLTKADITSAVKAALPDRDVVLQLDSREIGRASINRINSINLDSGGSVLKN